MTAYALGVDLGTTYSAAAIGRGIDAVPLQLGTDGAPIPSVVFLRDDGEVLVGDAAERRATSEPARAAREFKRRLGDPVPIVIGGVAQPVESLMAHLLRDIVRRATEQEGEPPSVIVLTHPANYTDFKTGTLRDAARLAGVDESRLVLITEPEAAAIAYTRQQQIAPGEIVAVYDFGGGTFDAALVRRTGDRFELIGTPEGMERLGGIDFDQAVLAHVDGAVGGLVSGADRNDPQTRPAHARLRVDCRRAKEALSADTDATIAVAVPGVQTEVRLTRDEFETMVRPRVIDTVRALERTIASAGLIPSQIGRVLLVGGSSRMPIVAEQVRAATGVPVALDAHPKLAIAIGAALAGGGRLHAAPPPPPGALTGAVSPPPGAMPPPPSGAAAVAWQAPTRVDPAAVASATEAATRSIRMPLAIAGGVLVGVLVVAGVVLFTGGDDDAATVATEPPAATGPVGSSETTVPVVPATEAPPDSAAPATIPATSAEAPPPTAAAAVGRGVDAVVTGMDLGPASGSPVVALTPAPGGGVIVLTSSGAIVRAEPSGITELATLDPAAGTPGGVAAGPDGTVYVTVPAGLLAFRDGASELVVDAALNLFGTTPGPVAVDAVGNVYFVDLDTSRIIRWSIDGSPLTQVAGTGAPAASGAPTGDGERADTVAIGTVIGLALDGRGTLWFLDATSRTVRTVSNDGTLATVSGVGATPVEPQPGTIVADGTSVGDLVFGTLDAIAVGPAGDVFVADAGSGVVLRFDAGTVSVVVARNPGLAPTDGAPANQTSIAALGPISVGRGGAVWFADDGRLRVLAAP